MRWGRVVGGVEEQREIDVARGQALAQPVTPVDPEPEVAFRHRLLQCRGEERQQLGGGVLGRTERDTDHALGVGDALELVDRLVVQRQDASRPAEQELAVGGEARPSPTGREIDLRTSQGGSRLVRGTLPQRLGDHLGGSVTRTSQERLGRLEHR